MLGFFKRLGWGVLYIVLLPLALIVLILTAIYCTFSFIYELILGIISFFKGKQFFPPLKEDLQAQEIIDSGSLKNPINSAKNEQNANQQNSNNRLDIKETTEYEEVEEEEL